MFGTKRVPYFFNVGRFFAQPGKKNDLHRVKIQALRKPYYKE
jgi:hypothetical protein